MYDHSDYMGHYQGSSSYGDPVETIQQETHYEPSTSTYSPNITRYTVPLPDLDHQNFVPIPNDVPYQQVPVSGYPQNWLSPPEQSLVETQLEQFSLPPQQDLATTTRWPSMPNSNSMNSNSRSSEDGGLPEELSPGDDGSQGQDKKKERKERRRAQNRVAQRLFRARREVSLKENSQRLESLEDEVGRLQINNEDLSDTVKNLRDEVHRLRRENVHLKRQLSEDMDAEEAKNEEHSLEEVSSILEPMSPNEQGVGSQRSAKGKEPRISQAEELQSTAAYFTRSSRDRR